MNNKITYIVAGLSLLLGSVGSIALQTYAQSTTSTAAVQTQTQNQSATNDANETNEPINQGHRPLGGDGVVSSINGSTIVVGEEADEGSASYTIDASTATVTNNGVVAKLSDIKVGDKVFVEGAVTGNNVKATSISLGHPGSHANEGPETNDDGETSTSTN